MKRSIPMFTRTDIPVAKHNSYMTCGMGGGGVGRGYMPANVYSNMADYYGSTAGTRRHSYRQVAETIWP
jgi:hypothetical protein